MIQFDLVEHGELLPNRMNKLFLSTKQQTFVTARDIANKLTKTGATVSNRTIQQHLNDAAAKYNWPSSSKSLRLPKCLKKIVSNRLKMKQSYELETGDLFRQDNHSSKYSKGIGMELARKKGGRMSRQVFEQGERTEVVFQVRVSVAPSISSRT